MRPGVPGQQTLSGHDAPPAEDGDGPLSCDCWAALGDVATRASERLRRRRRESLGIDERVPLGQPFGAHGAEFADIHAGYGRANAFRRACPWGCGAAQPRDSLPVSRGLQS